MLLISLISLSLIASCDNNIVDNNANYSNSDLSFINSIISDNSQLDNYNSSYSNDDFFNSSINSSDNSSIDNSPSSDIDTWKDGRIKLECGYYQMDLPKNHQNPIQLKTTLSEDKTAWSNNDLTSTLPEGFRYIYRNACDDGPINHKASPNFYSSNNNAPGGLKINKTGVGFQSFMFSHTGQKLEIRLGISQVNNNNDKYEDNKDTFHFYFFNNKGEFLTKYAVKEKTIKTSTTEIKFYVTENASEIAYFEFRCNAMPYQGQQCYNVGIKHCNIKSWEKA